MGFRFRKSINLGGGFKLNLSKSGVGYSWGGKGVRFTKTATGNTRSTFSIPGTGISYTASSSKSTRKALKKLRKQAQRKPAAAIRQIVPTATTSSESKSVKTELFDGLLSAKDRLNFSKPVMKLAALLLAAIIGFPTVNNTITGFFRNSASEKMILNAQAQYAEDVDTRNRVMLDQYESDKALYEAELASYEAACLSYSEAVEENRAAVAEYDIGFAAEQDDYQNALLAYEEELLVYNAAYEKAYEQAEEDLLYEGVLFKVSVHNEKIQSEEIGNDWSYHFSVNDTTVSGYSGTELSLAMNSGISIYTEIAEEDKSRDVGTAYDSHRMVSEDFENGFSLSHQVYVRENRGKNSGNTCIFEVTYNFSPMVYEVYVDPAVLPSKPTKPTEPVYSPPALNIQEPTAPTAPLEPLMADANLPEEVTRSIIATNKDVYANSGFAKFLHMLILLVAWPVVIVLVVRLIKETKKARREKEARYIEGLRQEFLKPEALPAAAYSLPSERKFSCEEEKHINIQFWKYLQLHNHLSYALHHNEYLREKTQSDYLEYDAQAGARLSELLQQSNERLKELNSQIKAFPDPLSHHRHIKKNSSFVRNSPFLQAPFAKKCSSHELAGFFKSSHVCYHETKDGATYVFTAYYLLKYSDKEHCFRLIDYENIGVSLMEGSATSRSPGKPDEVDILSVGWLYQTKSGKPDMRRADNPQIYEIYDGAVVFSIDGMELCRHYTKKELANKALNEAREQINAASSDNVLSVLTQPREDNFIQEPYVCPGFNII